MPKLSSPISKLAKIVFLQAWGNKIFPYTSQGSDREAR